jgi:hypothetical protein
MSGLEIVGRSSVGRRGGPSSPLIDGSSFFFALVRVVPQNNTFPGSWTRLSSSAMNKIGREGEENRSPFRIIHDRYIKEA